MELNPHRINVWKNLMLNPLQIWELQLQICPEHCSAIPQQKIWVGPKKDTT